MSSTENQQQNFPRVKYFLNAVADWVNRYRDTFDISDEFKRCGSDEVMQIARDLGASPAELREFVRKGPGAADLLQKMLIALKVDLDSITNNELGVMRDLQRICTMCADKKRCARELADGTAAKHFHEFCPNTVTLDALLNQIARGH
jgi:hypothetical protein